MRLAPLLLALATGWLPAQERDPPVLTPYRHFLDALDKSSLHALGKGLDRFLEMTPGLPPARVDSLAQTYMTFFYATISLHNDRMWEDLPFLERLHADDDRQDASLQPFYAGLEKNGLDLYTFGRLYYIDQQPDFLYRRLGGRVSPAVYSFLALRMGELAAGFSDQDSLVISFAQVAQRVIDWEQHLVNYPRSVVERWARFYYRTYLSTLLTGLRLSPVFDADGQLQPALVILYDDFSKRHSRTVSGMLVRQFYDSLIEGDFHWSTAVRDFYVAHGITNMHTAQVPYR